MRRMSLSVLIDSLAFASHPWLVDAPFQSAGALEIKAL